MQKALLSVILFLRPGNFCLGHTLKICYQSNSHDKIISETVDIFEYASMGGCFCRVKSWGVH